jgi:hypothetical protein
MNPAYPLVADRAEHQCEYCRAPELVFNVNSIEFFRFVIERSCPPTPQFWGTSRQDFSSKSLKLGGFRGLPGFVTAVKDFIEFTLSLTSPSRSNTLFPPPNKAAMTTPISPSPVAPATSVKATESAALILKLKQKLPFFILAKNFGTTTSNPIPSQEKSADSPRSEEPPFTIWT